MFLPLSFLGIVETIYAQTTILASIKVGRREWGKYSAPLSLRMRTGALWEMEFYAVLNQELQELRNIFYKPVGHNI